MKPNNKHNKTPEELKKAIDGVIEQVTKSTLSLRTICKQNGISHQTFYDYIHADEREKERYARAKVMQADAYFDEIIRIARRKVIKKDAKENYAYLQQKNMEIDTIKFVIGKLNPKKYGHKIEIETNGEEKLTMESFFENLKQTLKQTK